MTFRRKPALPLALLLFCLFATLPVLHAAQPDHWVGTWATSPVGLANPEGKYGSADTTYREIVHVTLAGSAVRIILSNEFGTDPLTIGAAHVAFSAGGNEIALTSANALTFGGKPSVTIPAGALIISDPTELKIPALTDVTVSLFIPAQPMKVVSQHSSAFQTSYTVQGNAVGARSLDAPKEIYNWPFLKGLDVRASANAAAIVTFGDSITDGALSTRNKNARWPDVLARRLQANKKTAELSVLNEGIGGNRVLHDVTGPSALARFDRDVLALAGVKYLVIMESINDIGHAQDPVKPYDVVTADEITTGFAQMAARAHTHGIRVYGATLTPYLGAKYSSPAGEAMRQVVNKWIRTTNQLDGFIDFDKVTQDPANPTQFLPANDSGDHLHPKDEGYKAMGDSIDLKLFIAK